MKILLTTLTSSFILINYTPHIKITTPKKPITININIKIKHKIIIKTNKNIKKLLKTHNNLF